jgi:hypothetical protein
MTHITEKELELLDRIIHDEFQALNGSTPESFDELTPVWAFVLETQADGGVFSNLKKKGLADREDYKGSREDDPIVWVTEAGYEAWKARQPKADDEFFAEGIVLTEAA